MGRNVDGARNGLGCVPDRIYRGVSDWEDGVMGKHTPGPWHWVNPETDEPTTGGYASLRTVKEFGENKTEEVDGLRVTTFALPKWILDAEEVSADDARLIACAPDMLEALIAIQKTCHENLHSNEMLMSNPPKNAVAYYIRDAARQAIRKATGEPQ